MIEKAILEILTLSIVSNIAFAIISLILVIVIAIIAYKGKHISADH